MEEILIISAVLTIDGQTYIYNVGGKPTSIKTGEPYCNSPKVLAILDADHLYPLEDTVEVRFRSAELTL